MTPRVPAARTSGSGSRGTCDGTWPTSPRAATRACSTRSRRTTSPTTATRWPRSSRSRTPPGLSVQASPWGLGRTFGGEAESRWVAFHPEECQVLDDGRRVAAACLNSPGLPRRSARSGPTGCSSAGSTRSSGTSRRGSSRRTSASTTPTRWTCRCDRCAERFGGPVPGELTPEVRRFREASVVDFLREVVDHVAARGARTRSACCPRPRARRASPTGTRSPRSGLWRRCATDPYWKHWDEAAGPFVRRFARLLRETAERHGVGAQLWVPSFGLDRSDIPELEAADRGGPRGRRRRPLDVGLRGVSAHDLPCHARRVARLGRGERRAHGSAADRHDGGCTPGSRRPRPPLDAGARAAAQRRGRDGSVRGRGGAGDALAAAIDANRRAHARGGRLIYAGAGTSGALAALDAAECGSTFGSPPGEVLAVVAAGRRGRGRSVRRRRTHCAGFPSGPRIASSPSARAARRRSCLRRSRWRATQARSASRSRARATARRPRSPSTRSRSWSGPR